MSETAIRNNADTGRSGDKPSADAVTKTLQVLERVAAESGRLGVRELARELGFGKSTTSRILQALERRGYVRFDEEESAYVLGAKILYLAGEHFRNLELRKVAGPYLREALEATGETVFLGMLDGNDVVILDRFDSPSPLRMVTELGTREPAHGTALGKVLLACGESGPSLDHLRKQDLRRFTSQTITDLEQLRKEIDKVREQGYAVDNEEHIEGVRCIAAPIRDAFGRVIAAVSVAGPTLRITTRRIDSVCATVQETARAVSGALGSPDTNGSSSS